MRAAVTVLASVVALSAASTATAAPAPNDSFANATDVSLPLVDNLNLDGSTTEPGEPQACNFQQQTVWYALALPPGQSARINLAGSSFGVVLNLWRSTGGGIGSLSFAGCLGFGGSMTASGSPGVTYYVQAGSVSPGSANLQLSIEEVPPPPNDDFVNAAPIGTLPFSQTVAMLAATTEPLEPLTPPGGPTLSATAWWTFTPGESGSILIRPIGCCAGASGIGVYTGTTLGALTAVATSRSFDRVAFTATAGTTYRLQYGHNGGVFSSGQLGIVVEETPAPAPALFFSPIDPTTFDTLSFSASGFDPAGFGFESYSWSFGDGATASGQVAAHRYASDGDYTAELTVTTTDGRTATTTGAVTVRTHDVGIRKLAVPKTASAGQSRSISVEVGTTRSDEQVTVQLLRSTVAGYEVVGSATQLVAMGGKRSVTTFPFRYTFTEADVAVGRVTFRATATIVGARDALTDDNELIAPATLVR